MAVEIMLGSKVVARSRNLRGLLDYARKEPPVSAAVNKTPTGGRLTVFFNDGALCHVEFADYSVACGWIAGRRSWDFIRAAHFPDYQAFVRHPGSARLP